MTTQAAVLNNGEAINYFEIGHENINKKPTLFFIHGNFSCWAWWTQTINVLKHFDYHIIAVDLRGFGDSTYNKNCSHLKDWAQDLVDFCSIKKINECIAIGWSFGGGVAMKLAEIAPNLVKKVILTSSVSYNGIFLKNNEVPCKTRQQIKQNPKLMYMNTILQESNRGLFTQILYYLLACAKDYPMQKCQSMITGSLKQKCYIDVLYALVHSDIDINKVKAKGLMIHGKKDQTVPLDQVISTAEYFKNFIVWEECAHMIPIEKIQEYANTVRNFVQEP